MIEAELIADDKAVDQSPTETEVSLLDVLVLLVARRRFILRFVLGTALLAIVVSFLLPIRYEAKVVLSLLRRIHLSVPRCWGKWEAWDLL